MHDHLVFLIHHRHPVIALDHAVAGFHLGAVVVGDITLDRAAARADFVLMAAEPHDQLLDLRLQRLQVLGFARRSSAEKFAMGVEAAALSEAALGEYCRNRGVYPEQLQGWRQVCEQANGGQRGAPVAGSVTRPAEQRRIRELERERRRKEKARAEAAALLVLRKKPTRSGVRTRPYDQLPRSPSCCRADPRSPPRGGTVAPGLRRAGDRYPHLPALRDGAVKADGRPQAVRPAPANTLSAAERAQVLAVCHAPAYANLPPSQIVPRLAKYSLKLNEAKTKLVAFSRRGRQQGEQQGSFDFLGFTFYLGRARRGQVIPKLKTSGKRLRTKLKNVEAWARRVRNRIPLKQIWKVFLAKLSGHRQYYAVSFNARAVSTFFQQAKRIMFRHLNRRSQRRSFNWEQFGRFVNLYPLPPVRIRHKLF